MTQQPDRSHLEISDRAREYIQELLMKAAEDAELRETLLTDPYRFLRTEPELSNDERTLLFSMRRVALEETGLDIRAMRSWLRDNGNIAAHDE